MKYKSNRVRMGTMMHPDVVKMCDENISKTSSLSRNDFIEEAIIFYVGHLNDKENKYLSESIQSVIKSNIQITEDRLSKIIFKLTVELSMLMNIVAFDNQLTDDAVSKLRVKCINDVKRNIGKINFEEVSRYQNSG